MASAVYNSFKRNILNGIILDQDDIRAILVTDAYVPDIDNHSNYGDVVSGEIAPTGGYSTSGVALTGKALITDTVKDRGVFLADSLLWSASTITARGAILYKYESTPETSPLIAYVDFGVNRSSQAGNFEVAWSTSDGILSVQ